MSTPLFAGAPTTKYLTMGLTATSLLATALDVHPSLQDHTTSRITAQNASYTSLLVHQTCYANPMSLFFSCVLLYHMRVLERLWGTRKFMSFLAFAILPCNALPIALAILSTSGRIPAPPPATLPTSLLFALLAKYHDLVPHSWQYSSAFSLSDILGSPGAEPQDNTDGSGRDRDLGGRWAVKPSSKWQTYVLAGQLAVGGGGGLWGLMAAAVGWGFGKAWIH